jgi:hypothetical protein
MIPKDELHENQVFMIAQALIESGKHTNKYELAREAIEITSAIKNDFVRYTIERFEANSKPKPEPAE